MVQTATECSERDTILATVRAPWSPGGDVGLAGELPCGSSTGRFRIVDVLGRGAMGVVYRAFDPQLGRHVALKVPHQDHCRCIDGGASTEHAGTHARARFVQEARGLAQLSHPNVVQVYSVERFGCVPGLSQGACAIAMEVVQGVSLEQWMRTPHGWADVVAVFAAAGRGLACAHAADLVHRDFKPSNVVLGNDGRVRVMDFGLVTTQRRDAGDHCVLRTVDDGDSDATLTREGTTLGTPAYMSPEQHLGRTADPRSDQFSFCVALFEALFGKRPFAGRSCDVLAANKQLGRRRPLPDGHRVPSRVVAAVLRGLSPQPKHRFASMAALLAALQPSRGRRELLRRAGVALVFALAGLGGGMLLPAPAAHAGGDGDGSAAGASGSAVSTWLRM